MGEGTTTTAATATTTTVETTSTDPSMKYDHSNRIIVGQQDSTEWYFPAHSAVNHQHKITKDEHDDGDGDDDDHDDNDDKMMNQEKRKNIRNDDDYRVQNDHEDAPSTSTSKQLQLLTTNMKHHQGDNDGGSDGGDDGGGSIRHQDGVDRQHHRHQSWSQIVNSLAEFHQGQRRISNMLRELTDDGLYLKKGEGDNDDSNGGNKGEDRSIKRLMPKLAQLSTISHQEQHKQMMPVLENQSQQRHQHPQHNVAYDVKRYHISRTPPPPPIQFVDHKNTPLSSPTSSMSSTREGHGTTSPFSCPIHSASTNSLGSKKLTCSPWRRGAHYDDDDDKDDSAAENDLQKFSLWPPSSSSSSSSSSLLAQNCNNNKSNANRIRRDVEDQLNKAMSTIETQMQSLLRADAELFHPTKDQQQQQQRHRRAVRRQLFPPSNPSVIEHHDDTDQHRDITPVC